MELTKENTRAMILKDTRKLEVSNIWIDEDYSKGVQRERIKLILHLKRAKDEGQGLFKIQ